MKKGKERLTAAGLAAIMIIGAGLLSCGEESDNVGPGGFASGASKDYEDYGITGYVNDRATGYVIPDARIDYWCEGVYWGHTYTNGLGGYYFWVGPESYMKTFAIRATKPGYGYGPADTTFRYYVLPVTLRWHNKDMCPAEPGGGEGNGGDDPDRYYGFDGFVNDYETGYPVGAARLDFYDQDEGYEYIGWTTTNYNGYYMFKLYQYPTPPRDRHNIIIHATKEGYADKVSSEYYYDDPTATKRHEFDMRPITK